MTSQLPEAGDQFTFEYDYLNHESRTVLLVVLDVDDTEILYSMPALFNQAFTMTHEYWLRNDDKRVPVCKHERGWIENHRRFPATYEMPSEETGRVHCSGCDEEWTLGYEPSGIELNAEKYNSEHPEEAR